MIKHIVMLRIQDFAEGKTKHENAVYMKEILESLKEKIPQIIKLEVGINFKHHQGAFDIVLFVEFNSKEDLDAYIANPEHKKVAEYIIKVRSDRAVIDYEC